MTGRPCLTAYVTASSLAVRMRSRVQSSAYCRIGEEPMKVAASIGIPTSSATRTIGSTSAITVRAAQLGKMRSEEHTSELQSHSDLVCRLLLEKKKKTAKQTRRLVLQP